MVPYTLTYLAGGPTISRADHGAAAGPAPVVGAPVTDATTWRDWAPDATAALFVLFAGLPEAILSIYGMRLPDATGRLVLVLGIAAAVGLSRRAPGVALGLLWVLGFVQVAGGVPIMIVEVAVAAVFFGTARWGRPPTITLGAVSVPLAVVIAYVLYQRNLLNPDILSRSVLDETYRAGTLTRVIMVLVGLLFVAAPWPAGLALRFRARAHASQTSMLAAEAAAAGARRQTEQAREIARLREQQNQLARDVHDVVGHSLAVILAQAESAQYVEDTGTLKKTMQTIATSARASLGDVRQVLSPTPDPPARPGAALGLDGLIAGVRDSGHEIVDTELGPRRPLPPEIDVVAYRVLQEMLTNAIKHGRRDQPILVERHWPAADAVGGFADTLRIDVTNTMSHPAEESTPTSAPATGGRGLEGMRRRLESIGGHLDVRRREQPAGATFTVTAWMPVRGGPR